MTFKRVIFYFVFLLIAFVITTCCPPVSQNKIEPVYVSFVLHYEETFIQTAQYFMTRRNVIDVAEITKWSPEKEIAKGLACRRQEGLPMYVARFAGRPLTFDGRPAFMMK